jgi:hypothetical protein
MGDELWLPERVANQRAEEEKKRIEEEGVKLQDDRIPDPPTKEEEEQMLTVVEAFAKLPKSAQWAMMKHEKVLNITSLLLEISTGVLIQQVVIQDRQNLVTQFRNVCAAALKAAKTGQTDEMGVAPPKMDGQTVQTLIGGLVNLANQLQPPQVQMEVGDSQTNPDTVTQENTESSETNGANNEEA